MINFLTEEDYKKLANMIAALSERVSAIEGNPVLQPDPAGATDPVDYVDSVDPVDPVDTVGDRKIYSVKTIDEFDRVPWLTLEAGDTVKIYPLPHGGKYNRYAQIRGVGTEDNKITIEGVIVDGKKPIITCLDAGAVYDLNYQNWDAFKWVIGGGSFILYRDKNDPYEHKPKHITFKNLDMEGVNYLGSDGLYVNYLEGKFRTWDKSHSPFYIPSGGAENIIIQGCHIKNYGNGFFCNSVEGRITKDLLIDSCIFELNGVIGSDKQHGLYVQAFGATINNCEIRANIKGSLGSAFKDRSAGLVFTNNIVWSGSRVMDLVDTDAIRSFGEFGLDHYDDALVRGCKFIVDPEDEDSQGHWAGVIFHWGGDNGVFDEKLFRSTARIGRLTVEFCKIYINNSNSYRSVLFQQTEDDCNVLAIGLDIEVANTRLLLNDSMGSVTFQESELKSNMPVYSDRKDELGSPVTDVNTYGLEVINV